MSPLDLILLIPFVYGAYNGYNKGFLTEAVHILSFVIAVIAGLKLLHLGIDFLEPVIGKDNTLIPFVAFLVIFATIILTLTVLGKKLKKHLDHSIFGKFDNIIGAVVGVSKWAFAVSLILWLLSEANVEIPTKYTNDSFMYPVMLEYSPLIIKWVSSLLPFAKSIIESIKNLFL